MREYQRSFGKSYMIVSQEEWQENYRLQMIEQNNIHGLLPMKKVSHGTGVQFWYDITGKNSVDIYMKNHIAEAGFLEQLIYGLQKACRSMREYLLDETGICLEPESIYIGNSDEQIYFCYQVWEQNNFELEFRNFMEFFLQKMGHTDQESVRICYGIYDGCAGGHFQLEDLVEKFCQKPINKKEDNTVGERKPCDIADMKEKQRKHIDIKANFFQNKIKFLSDAVRKVKDVNQHKDEVILFEPTKENIQASNPTIFLGSETKDILGQLKYEGNKTGNNFLIDKSPFILGNKANEVDGLLSAATVSRIHARITKDEKSNYYIEDMNSTNGTYINGNILNYRETYMLCKNDRVQFADITYRFV